MKQAMPRLAKVLAALSVVQVIIVVYVSVIQIHQFRHTGLTVDIPQTLHNYYSDSPGLNHTSPRLNLTSVRGHIDETIFQAVDDGLEFWLYSAFYDNMSTGLGQPLVKILGLVANPFPKDITCHLHMPMGSVTVRGIISGMREQHGKRVPCVFINCNIFNYTKPINVSISTRTNKTLTNNLPVQYPGHKMRTLTVCHAALHSKFNSASQLVQSFEMNRILGAEHVYIYNTSVTAQVDRVLRHYVTEGFLSVIQWSLPSEDVRYYAQMAAISDCVFRNRNVSEFVVVLDTDEFIIPRKVDTWSQLIASIDSGQPNMKFGSFVVRGALFGPSPPVLLDKTYSTELSRSEREFASTYDVFFLNRLYRRDKIFPPRYKSKCIIRTKLVTVMGIHQVYNHVKGARTAYVDPNIALLQHYRSAKNSTVFEPRMLKYKDKLVPKLREAFSRFPDIFPPY